MPEIFGIGTDIVEIARMEKNCTDDRFLNRFFTEEEILYIRSKNKMAAQTMAGIFAAKEAASKAMGTGITFDLREIWTVHDDKGKPGYRITGSVAEFLKGCKLDLSISHDAGIAIAFCVISKQ